MVESTRITYKNLQFLTESALHDTAPKNKKKIAGILGRVHKPLYLRWKAE